MSGISSPATARGLRIGINPIHVDCSPKDDIIITGIYESQVGGHSPLLKAKGGKLCKPLILQEYGFYDTLEKHPSYRRWTATVFGSFEISQHDLRDWVNGLAKKKILQRNQWVKDISKRLAKRLKETDEDPHKLHKYMVIEDLTRYYKHPCVMDVKVGTRTFGDDATEAKKISQGNKCTATTTASLGVRLCGYKVFYPRTKSVTEVDKYAHRKLDKDTIIHSLYEYFHTGNHLRREVIQKFIDHLQTLRQTMEQDEAYRIYSSSLLFMYEGSIEEPANVQVKMIDFEHTFLYTDKTKDLDDGYQFGLNSLIYLLETILGMKDTIETGEINNQIKVSAEQDGACTVESNDPLDSRLLTESCS